MIKLFKIKVKVIKEVKRLMEKKNEYYINQHSCFLLQYHLVLITKYRHPVIVDDLKETLINYVNDYFIKYKLKILEINTDKDHIHIMFEAIPNINLANFINGLKTGSSRYIRIRYKEFLGPFYWKPYFWSASYFLGTVSEKSTKIVANYIKNQSKDI